MRDLEIRGAGNLLGPEQSGHIAAVGFELYCQLLKQSVASLKGEKIAPRAETIVRLDFVTLTESMAGRNGRSRAGRAGGGGAGVFPGGLHPEGQTAHRDLSQARPGGQPGGVARIEKTSCATGLGPCPMRWTWR